MKNSSKGFVEKNKVKELRRAINEGIESGIAEDFNPIEFLESLKARKRKD